MTPLVTSAFAADLDRRTLEELGVPQAALMENAAAGMETATLGLCGPRGTKRGGQETLTALVGRGSNGGDALAVLRRLSFRAPSDRKPDLAVILSSGEPVGLAADQLRSVRACGARVLAWEGQEKICRALLEDSSVVLDGIAGTGISGPLRPRERSLAEAANASGATVAAIDIPSGAGDFVSEGAAVVKAAATLCVEPRKVCVYRPALRPFAGRILPITGVFPNGSGSESPYRLMESGDIADLVPPLRPEAHKYERGHCLVFAGAPGTTGAAVLAARGATAGGAGLVTLHVRPEIWNATASRLAGEIVAAKPRSGRSGFRSGAGGGRGTGLGTG